MNAVDILKEAKALFEKKGGAQGVPQDTYGRICATEACCQTIRLNSALPIFLFIVIGYLDDAALALYGDHVTPRTSKDDLDFRPSAQINDKLGINAVLSMYDWAIKKAEDAKKEKLASSGNKTN